MTEPIARPWWASDPAAAGPETDDDPVTAHRAARRGTVGHSSDGADGAASWWAAALAGVAALADGLAANPITEQPRASSDDDHDIDVCGVCPLCTGLRALHESNPDLARHLSEAARHLAAAARDLAEHPPRGLGRDDGGGTDTFEHIDLD